MRSPAALQTVPNHELNLETSVVKIFSAIKRKLAVCSIRRLCVDLQFHECLCDMVFFLKMVQ